MGTKISHDDVRACYSRPLMPPIRSLRSALLGLFVPTLLVAACGTEAVGVSECRDIEDARCEAGAFCTELTDVAACRRFHRDHCLHGLGVEEVGSNQVNQCVDALRRAGECARDQGPTTEPGLCATPVPSSAANVCDIVNAPELAEACAFLVAPVQ